MEEVFINLPWGEIGIVVVCLVFSAFFSSSETALTSLTREKALQLLEGKSSSKKYIRAWVDNPNKILTLILIGNNLVNILATALVTVIAHSIFKDYGVSYAVGMMTFLILVFGEIVPKTLARAIAPGLSMFSMRFLIVLYYITYPLTYFFVKLSQIVGNLVGVEQQKHVSMLSQKDLDFLIELASKEGRLKGTRGEYLKAVAEFDELKVRNIMIPKNQVSAIEASITIPKLIEIIEHEVHTRYPVYEDNFENFIGLLHVKDLLLKKEECEEKNSIVSILRPVLWTNEYMRINDVLQTMKENKSQLALIKDEYNEFSGIITMEDILEELVGEISDEHDKDDNIPEANGASVVEVNGDAPVHDLNERFDMEIPEDKDFQTINGFLLNLFNGILPEKNTILLWNNFEIKITSIKSNAIDQIEIKSISANKTNTKG